MQNECKRLQAAIEGALKAAGQMEKQQKWLQQEACQLEVKVTPDQQSRVVQVCCAMSCGLTGGLCYLPCCAFPI